SATMGREPGAENGEGRCAEAGARAVPPVRRSPPCRTGFSRCGNSSNLPPAARPPSCLPAVERLADPCFAGAFPLTPLLSDVPGLAPRTDARLVDPWGIAAAPGSREWIASRGSGIVFFHAFGCYGGALSVHVPPDAALPRHGVPTGMVYNPSGDFVV